MRPAFCLFDAQIDLHQRQLRSRMPPTRGEKLPREG